MEEFNNINSQAFSGQSNPAQRPVIDGVVYPRIGLALGSGAAKAICQLGVLKRLNEHNIPISYICGSSMGAIIGAIYALGLDIDLAVEKTYRYAEATNVNNLSHINVFHESVYKKELIDKMLTELFADFRFEDCKIPFSVTSVDLESGKLVILDKGPLVPAVRASTSFPGIFEPVLLNGHYLVDGGLIEDCPITTVRGLGSPDILFGCVIKDLKNRQFVSAYIYNKFYKNKKDHNFFMQKIDKIKNDLSLFGTIIWRSIDILRSELWEYQVVQSKPDVVININIEKINFFDANKTRDLIRIGEKAFDEHYEELILAIEKKKKELNAPGGNGNL